MKFFLATLLSLILATAALAQDVYEIRFTAGVTQHRGALVLFDDGTGLVRIRYYNNGTKMVEQKIRIQNTRNGLRLACYNPVYPGTTRRHPSYVADNFYLTQNEYGKTQLVNIDDQGVTANVVIRKLEGTTLTNRFLTDFNWKL